MQGICIDTGLSAILKEGETYYLFEHGINNYYVSNFNRSTSHFGSFQKKYFEVVDEVNSTVEAIDIEANQPERPKRYVAVVNSFRVGYFMGSRVIAEKQIDDEYFNVWSYNRPDRAPIGTYLKPFFEIIEPYEENQDTVQSAPKATEIRTKTVESVIGEPKIVPKEIKSERKASKAERKRSNSEQLSLFEMEW